MLMENENIPLFTVRSAILTLFNQPINLIAVCAAAHNLKYICLSCG